MKSVFAFCLALLSAVGAHAQLITNDNGLTLVDSSGLMVANDVGLNLGITLEPGYGGAADFIATLNAQNYGGYNDWSLVTGDYTASPNVETNQLGQIFLTDCGNVAGTVTSFANPGKNCSGFTAAIQANALGTGDFHIPNDVMYISSTIYPEHHCIPAGSCLDFTYGTYSPAYSSQGYFFNDTVYEGLVGSGDVIATRRVPELDPASAGSGLTMLLGGLLVMRGRRRA